jgi:histidinol-phosphate aminotransferase
MTDPTSRRRYTRLVEALPVVVPFVPPEALERRIGRKLRLRLGANESAFGPSPKAVAAMAEGAAGINHYGDPEGYALRSAIAARHGISRDNIALGSGIDEIEGLLVRACMEPGETVVMSHGSYPTFAYHVNGRGGKLVTIPYAREHNDLEALGQAAREHKARIVFLVNPDNPTGTWLSASDQLRLIERLPDRSVLILDEAYADFAPAESLPDLDAEDRRVIRLRTFSKAHGLAGARIGYVIAPAETIVALDKIRNHFAVNRLAQQGALASLSDPDFVADVVAQVALGREDYAQLAASLGLKTLPSATNFVAIDMGTSTRAKETVRLLLEDEAVFIRMPGVAPLDRHIRVTIGTPEERALFAPSLARVVAKLG